MERRKRALAEWRTGWRYVLCNDVGQMCVVTNTYTTGMMIKPLHAAFGWSRGEVSTALAIFSVVTFFGGPLMGILNDRYGPRRLALICAPLAGAAIVGMGLVGPYIWTWYLAWIVYSLVALGIGTQIWAMSISRHFDVSRGLALAVGTSGNGLGALLWPWLTVTLMSFYGWRMAYFGIGGLIGVGLTAACYLLLRGPAALSRDHTPAGGVKPVPAGGMSWRQAVSTSTFWRMAIGLMVMGAAATSMLFHLPALLTDKGLTPGQAAAVMATVAPAVIAGRLFGGVLLDRIHGRYVMLAMFLTPAAACLVLVGYHGGFPRAVVAAVLAGLTSGLEGDLICYLTGRYFGLRHFGKIYASMVSVFVVGFGMGPALAGTVFDRLGSYDPGLIGMAVLLLICAPFALTLGRYRYGGEVGAAAQSEPSRRKLQKGQTP